MDHSSPSIRISGRWLVADPRDRFRQYLATHWEHLVAIGARYRAWSPDPLPEDLPLTAMRIAAQHLAGCLQSNVPNIETTSDLSVWFRLAMASTVQRASVAVRQGGGSIAPFNPMVGPDVVEAAIRLRERRSRFADDLEVLRLIVDCLTEQHRQVLRVIIAEPDQTGQEQAAAATCGLKSQGFHQVVNAIAARIQDRVCEHRHVPPPGQPDLQPYLSLLRQLPEWDVDSLRDRPSAVLLAQEIIDGFWDEPDWTPVAVR